MTVSDSDHGEEHRYDVRHEDAVEGCGAAD
jgi:hypothetical protein